MTSWFLVAALIAIIMAPLVEQVQPGLGALKYVAGLAFAVLLYGSVLLHEASHAIVAKRLGYPVSSITLHFLGGMTSIEGEAKRPREEFFIAVVGPLTSMAVGVAALLLLPVTPDGLTRLAMEGLAGANLLVGVLNLVPGLPLDGGRVLKAGVWGLTGSIVRGTVVAGWGGRLAAVAVLAWPVAQESVLGTPPDVIDFVLAFVVAAFLWSGATASMSAARLRSRIPHLVARDLARRTPGLGGGPAGHPRGPASLGAHLQRRTHARGGSAAAGRAARGGPRAGADPHACRRVPPGRGRRHRLRRARDRRRRPRLPADERLTPTHPRCGDSRSPGSPELAGRRVRGLGCARVRARPAAVPGP